MKKTTNYPALLTPREVADLFRVNPKTVVRWGDIGLLRTVRTPSNHRRFFRDEVERLYARQQDARQEEALDT